MVLLLPIPTGDESAADRALTPNLRQKTHVGVAGLSMS